MSEELQTEKVEEVEAEAATEQAAEQESMSLDDLKIGYVVGVKPDGNFVFQVFGQEQGLIELLGINAHANSQVKSMYDRNLGTGDALTLQVGQALGVLNQKLDQVLGAVAPKQPDNKL